MEMQSVSGTRSWSSNTKVREGDEVFVKANYFNKEKAENKYSDCLLYKENSILKGTVLSVFSNTVSVKFAIDGVGASVNKSCLMLKSFLTSQQFKYVLPIISDDEGGSSNTFYDSDADPEFIPKSSELLDDSSDSVCDEFSSSNCLSQVNLCKNGKPFFLAEIDKKIAITVHGVSANSNERRFFIKKVYDNAKKWKHFDEDVHSLGSAILWDINCTATISTTYGHDGNPPTKLEKPKRKRNESEWQKKIII